MKITTGLLEFQIYLDYLQNKFEENAKAMQMRTKALVRVLKQKVSVSCLFTWYGRDGLRAHCPGNSGMLAHSGEAAAWEGKGLRNMS